MDIDLEELKQQLRSKRFSLDDVRPLAERAVRVIDRLEAENQALVTELHQYRTAETQLKKIREAIASLLSEKDRLNIEQASLRLATILDGAQP